MGWVVTVGQATPNGRKSFWSGVGSYHLVVLSLGSSITWQFYRSGEVGRYGNRVKKKGRSYLPWELVARSWDFCRPHCSDFVVSVSRTESGHVAKVTCSLFSTLVHYGSIAPPQELPAPAVHPKQCRPVTIVRCANHSGEMV